MATTIVRHTQGSVGQRKWQRIIPLVPSRPTTVRKALLAALAGSWGARLAAGQATPGVGIIERINVYTSLLWIAVLAIALLRRPRYGGAGTLPFASGARVGVSG